MDVAYFHVFHRFMLSKFRSQFHRAYEFMLLHGIGGLYLGVSPTINLLDFIERVIYGLYLFQHRVFAYKLIVIYFFLFSKLFPI